MLDLITQLPPGYLVGFIFLLGLTTGSFANVCIYRMPRKESVVFPASHCPSCNTPIKAYDNIPVLGYLMLGGKCRSCKSSISPIYPIVEFVTGVLMAWIVFKMGLNFKSLVYVAVTPVLVVITMIDLEHQIIPDRITLPGIVFGLVVGYFLVGWKASLIGFLLGGGLFYAIAVLSRGGMGGGDVKYIAGAGALLGWQYVLLIIFLGSLLGSIVGLALIVLQKKGRKSKIPFGPYLTLATYISFLYGDALIHWYISTFA